MKLRASGSPRRLGALAAALATLTWAAFAAPLASFRRVVLVSFDGIGGLELKKRQADHVFGEDGFARLGRLGFSSDRLIVVTPSSTAVSHAAISAGTTPSFTGIVANSFHANSTPLRDRVSGFDMESSTEMLWEAAARQGKRVASLCWPGLAQDTVRTTTPVGLRYYESKDHGLLWQGSSAKRPFEDALVALPGGIVSFSPPKRIPMPRTARQPIFLAIDTTDDGRTGYDHLVAVAMDGTLAARGRVGDWFALPDLQEEDQGDRDVLFGQWGKLLSMSSDLSRVSIYLSPPNRTYAAPDDFRRTLDRQAGFWPGPPDPLFLEGPEPDTVSFVEQSVRFARFFDQAFAVADRRGDWDLLLAYQPLMDQAAHRLLLVDKRQGGYSPERARRAAAALKEIWKQADRSTAEYLRFAPRGDVFVVSDHGMRPIVRSFALGEALRRRGWLKSEALPSGRIVVAPDSPVDLSVGGGTAHISVNRAGSLPGGTISPERCVSLVDEIATYLRSLQNEEGSPLFALVATRAEAEAQGLNHPNAGDLVVIGRGGTSVNAWLARAGQTPPLLGIDELAGQHGFDPDPELDGIFFHVGDGIAAQRVPTFREVDVAGRISQRLGIDPPGRLGIDAAGARR
ncbi:MAG: alkaline phosphatase family protein [Thermoanaerobaculia bacterium]